MLCENVNADMPVFLDAVAGAQPDLPDEDVPCQLLRPREGMIEYVAGNHLHKQQRYHQQIGVDQNGLLKMVPTFFQHLK